MNFHEWPQDSIDKFAAMLEQVIKKAVREEMSKRETPESSIADVIRTQGWEAAKKLQHNRLKGASK